MWTKWPLTAILMLVAIVLGIGSIGSVSYLGIAVAAADEKAAATKVQETRDPKRLWCNEHNIYEDECVICHPEIAQKTGSKESKEKTSDKAELPEKRDPKRLWCKEHSVYEDECYICHPELKPKATKGKETKQKTKEAPQKRDPKRLWCNEHSVYEDECYICHPELAPDEKAKGAADKETSETQERDPKCLWCKEHSRYEDECYICHPELEPKDGKATASGSKGKTTTGARDPKRLWCKEHSRYEDECYICHPELDPKNAQKGEAAEPEAKTSNTEHDPNRLWCKEHDRYEDECYICHPELGPKGGADTEQKSSAGERDPNRLWCKEHDRYEDECYICHPELKDNKASAAGEEGSAGALMCKEHDLPEIDCGNCHPDRLAELAVGEGMKVRFASDLSTSKAGVATGVPAAKTTNAAQELLGEVSFNKNRLAIVTPLGAGVVQEVMGDVGDTVKAGQILATVSSQDVATTRSEYMRVVAEANLARQTLTREQDLYQRKISPRQDYEQAQAAVAVAEAAITESRQHLRSLGLSEKDIQNTSDQDVMSVLPVRAPFAATIIERTAIAGTAVELGVALYTIADLSSVWLQLSVPEASLSSISTGTAIQARFEAYPGMLFEGEVEWIAPTVDQSTRMVQARAVLPNPQGLLKEGLFGRATLTGVVDPDTVTVPADAIQDVDGRPVIFRKLEDDLFETRIVETGRSSGESIVVRAGLAADEEIVTEGSYIVKSELLKSRLGAGCTDH